jgi:hypothetical protein
LSRTKKAGTQPAAASAQQTFARRWAAVGLGAISDFSGRLGGYAQEMQGEAAPREIHERRIADIRELLAECHYRFPPDFFEPGTLEVRNGWSSDEACHRIDHLPAELQRLLKAFRFVEDVLTSAGDILDVLTDSDRDDAFLEAHHKVGRSLQKAHQRLQTTFEENCRVLQEA